MNSAPSYPAEFQNASLGTTALQVPLTLASLFFCDAHLQNPMLHIFHSCICATDYAGETYSGLTSHP